DRVSALGQPPAHHPVVAADATSLAPLRFRALERGAHAETTYRCGVGAVFGNDDVARLEADAAPEGVVQLEDVGREQTAVDRGVESDVGSAWCEVAELEHGVRTKLRDRTPTGQLAAGVAGPALVT